MTTEGPKGLSNKLRSGDDLKHEFVTVYTTNTGDSWYLDADGKVIVLDETGDDERNRQQIEPNSEPKPGYPKFGSMMMFKEIPANASRESQEPSEEDSDDDESVEISSNTAVEKIPHSPSGDNEELNQSPGNAISPAFITQRGDDFFDNVTSENLEEKLAQVRADEAVAKAEIAKLRATLTPAQINKLLEQVKSSDRAKREHLQRVRDALHQPKQAEPRPSEAPQVSPVQPLNAILHSPNGIVPNFIKRNFSRFAPTQESIIRQEPPSMSAINADPKKKESFARLLQTLGFDDLAEKHRQSKENPDAMSPQDEENLVHARKEYQRRSALALEMRAGLRGDDLLYMLQQNPSFAFLRNNVSVERADALIRANMESVFMVSGDEEINTMVYAQRAMRDIRASKQYQGLTERVKSRLGSAASVENMREELLDPKAFKKIFTPGFFAFGESKARSFQTSQALGENVHSIMAILGASLSGDRKLRMALAAEGDPGNMSKKDHEPEKSHASAPAHAPEGNHAPTAEAHPKAGDGHGESHEAAGEDITMKNLRESISGFKKSYEKRYKGHKWETDTAEQRQSNFINSLKEQEDKTIKASHSWLRSLFAAIFSGLITRAKHDPQIKQAFAH